MSTPAVAPSTGEADPGPGPGLGWIFSVDDHVVEPPDLWERRLPTRFSDAGPRVERAPDGEQFWVFGALRKGVAEQGARLFRRPGLRDLIDIPRSFDDLRPGCFDPLERVKDMDAVGVSASVCFPSFPRFAGQAFLEVADRELGLACVRAYNDWILEEWHGAAPGRLVPLVILPLWDVELARSELERCGRAGARTFTFPENPFKLGLPSLYDAGHYWEPLFHAAADLEMPACTHIGSSSVLPQSSPDASIEAGLTLLPINLMTTLVDWIFSGVFVRVPGLRLCLSEGGIGWIPFALERADHCFRLREQAFIRARHNGLGHLVDTRDLETAPSEIFAEHIFGCLLDEPFGSSVLEAVPPQNVMVEVDYPHADCTWPRSPAILGRQLGHLDTASRAAVLEGNARRVFGFDPDVPGAIGGATAPAP